MKRLIDISFSLIGLLLLAGPITVIAFLVRFNIGAPVLFYQIRPGLRGKNFRMIKFRTMTEARGADGELLEDSVRLTSFGRMLRSTSLDELPELWNVLLGNMSLVGPRPLLVEYMPLYSEEQARRHEVRPGLTGWAQVNGRNTISWDEKFKLDVWYVDNNNIILDFKILWMTVRRVILREGISATGEATMPRFTGSSQQKGSS